MNNVQKFIALVLLVVSLMASGIFFVYITFIHPVPNIVGSAGWFLVTYWRLESLIRFDKEYLTNTIDNSNNNNNN